VATCLAHSSILKMEAVHCSEMSVNLSQKTAPLWPCPRVDFWCWTGTSLSGPPGQQQGPLLADSGYRHLTTFISMSLMVTRQSVVQRFKPQSCPLMFGVSTLHHSCCYIVAYLLKARTVGPEKQPLLGNGCVTRDSGVTVRSGVFCAVRADAI
jgi:hypothetical protein